MLLQSRMRGQSLRRRSSSEVRGAAGRQGWNQRDSDRPVVELSASPLTWLAMVSALE